MSKSHMKTGTAEYRCWCAMRRRCYYEKCDKYKYYGGKGIRVCDRWRWSFESFYADMGDKPSPQHSLDRIDPNKDYQPANCRWATKAEQSRNRSSHVVLECDGQSKTVTEWSKASGVSALLIAARVRNGMDAKQAIWARSGTIRPAKPKEKLKRRCRRLEDLAGEIQPMKVFKAGFKDHNKKEYGRLKVDKLLGVLHGNACWLCNCSCGNQVVVCGGDLGRKTNSCGCLSDEKAADRRKTHGESSSPEYEAWQGMKKRCCPPTAEPHKDYGGRGVTVCQRWVGSFPAFLEDMGRKPSSRHSLDRIDSNGDYEPGNCRWATDLQQNQNTKRNRMLTMDGTTLPASEWSRRTGLPAKVLLRRQNDGWTDRESLTVPLWSRRICPK